VLPPIMLCDIGYVIQDHLPALMQIMTNELTDYSMQLMTTKCLNTAIMMWYLFLGEREGTMEDVVECESRAVQARGKRAREEHESKGVSFVKSDLHPLNVATRFSEDLLETLEQKQKKQQAKKGGKTSNSSASRSSPAKSSCNMPSRTIFYVILTDAYLPRTPTVDVKNNNNNNNKVPRVEHFPGHCFVIEKMSQRPSRNRYNIYQSYINKYTLEGHVEFNRSLGMSQEKAADLTTNIRRLFSEPAWSPEDTAFWKRFTHVSVPNYEGFQFSDQSYMCYRKADTTNCISHLRSFLERINEELEKRLASGQETPEDVYGNDKLYTGNQRTVEIQILTNAQMRRQLDELLQKL